MRTNFNPQIGRAELPIQSLYGGLPERVAVPYAGLDGVLLSPCETPIRGEPCGKMRALKLNGVLRCRRCGQPRPDPR